MVFSSHLFIFYFLPLALLLYYAAPNLRLRHFVLTALSYLFYGWANPLFVVLMMTSTLIDYFCGLAIARQWGGAWKEPVLQLESGGDRSRTQRIALIVSICSNLSLLGFFKYFNFGISSYNALVQSLGLEAWNFDLAFRITLPLGISFYTFQSMSYSIDVYRGHAKAIRQAVDFFCYVSMFPQLVAGPIIRFSEVADQLQNRTHTLEKFARGAAFVALGLTKKIMIANPCGKVADVVFDAGSVSCLDSWYGVVAYSFQIYFDFSAYSDMAIGLGLMLGFVFPKNFDSPYHSKSITEFWRRWHISLSSWLRDYLYVPLGGNRKGPTRTYINLMLVMLLGGLWHGASWNFVIWGGIHGVMLSMERMHGKSGLNTSVPPVMRLLFTYLIVLITWVFFRAVDLPAAMAYCKSMLGQQDVQAGSSLIQGIIYQPYYLGSLLLAAVVTWAGVQTWDFTRRLTSAKLLIVFGLFVLSLLVLTTQSYNPFIYFIF
ncbi:MBOAT family O-acyltransferase [Pontiella sulfatireligans]|uniref:Peptidoglycan O-acetyltransferase n=1 Tax=Pontiella sulfatireligans TaxID=2750658 RepID=A0A6C2UNX9_9BACT|nr:MBOAT family O-acyltransferase [Pontiella sulfatireligans]VGO21653.1 Peptidoglycan O-acetyltransferase [Pontiella sulfatireligans]